MPQGVEQEVSRELFLKNGEFIEILRKLLAKLSGRVYHISGVGSGPLLPLMPQGVEHDVIAVDMFFC